MREAHSDRAVARTMSESELRRLVLDYAGKCGWLRSYFAWNFRSRNVIKGDTGFPDLVLCRPPQLVIVELKNELADPYDNQERWLIALRSVSTNVAVHVWRPSDWLSGSIAAQLA